MSHLFPKITAAADQCHGGGGVVRRPIRPLPPARDVETAAQGLHCGGFQRFVLRHRRQDPGKAGRQHRLAGTGRADQQQAVLARRGHFHGAPGLQLPLDVAEIRIGRQLADRLRLVPLQPGGGIARAEVGADIQQGGRREDLRLGQQCGFVGIGGRQDEAAPVAILLLLALHGAGHGQRAANGQQLARQRQFAGIFVVVQTIRRHLFGGGEDAQGDGQVEATGVLGQVGGGQVDGNAAGGEFKPGVLQRRPDAVLGFLHLGLGESDDGNGRLLTR